MKTIEIAEATAPLAEYARTNRRQTLVLTRRGRPFAALIPIPTPTDLESFMVSSSPRLETLTTGSPRVSPAETGLSNEQVRRVLTARRTGQASRSQSEDRREGVSDRRRRRRD
jgi:antitoxin (DNA-binding transcriptional repressor) of toxin-antitoxin stability system